MLSVNAGLNTFNSDAYTRTTAPSGSQVEGSVDRASKTHAPKSGPLVFVRNETSFPQDSKASNSAIWVETDSQDSTSERHSGNSPG